VPALRRAMIWILFFEIVIGALSGGITLRRATWDWTQEIRRSDDLQNGWGWGQRALRYGFFHLYDHVIAHCPDGDYTLDYTPLRLAVMTAWARWTNQHENGAAGWRDDYAFTAPLLYFNTVMALLAAIGIFMIVRLWTVRAANAAGVADSPYWFARPLTAAILFWINPALLLDAHAWPQWDIWPMPFFLFALLAACTDRWLLTGALLAIGVMLKGQLILVAPLFIFWPLFLRRWCAAADVLLTFATTIALITAPGTIGHGAIFVAAAVATAWFLTRGKTVAAAISPSLRVRIIIATGVAALFLCPPLFEGSYAWFKVGFTYGAAKFPDMVLGAENLAAILQRNFGLHCDDIAFAVPALHIAITVKQLLSTAYFVTLILAARAAAHHSAGNDPRFLVAAVMPWLCFFALLTQMHERYLVWAACLSALWLAAGPAVAALHLLITTASVLILIQHMTATHPTALPTLTNLTRITSPALAWTVLIAAALVTLASLTKSRTSGAT
jgi:hypothetical protein